MKALLVLLRIIIVGILWGIVFTEGIRVIMLCNWHFDIFWPDHWRQAKELWQAGWVVRAPKEWAFVIILATFFPMLITGWWTLCLVEWEKIIGKILMLPVRAYQRFIKTPLNVITTNNKYGVVKKKSYKQVRPLGILGSIRSPISDYGDSPKPAAPAYVPVPSYSQPKPAAKPAVKTDVSATIDHALFKFDDDEDDDFDLDIDSFEKTDIKKQRESEPVKKQNKKDNAKFNFDDDDEEQTSRNNRRSLRNQNRNDEQRDSSKNERNDRNKNKHNRDTEESKPTPSNKGPVFEILQQKGYDIIENIKVNNTLIDFIGVSENKICLCLADRENGDWLADEELFNGEEPLWFSESSHRVSPVRKLKSARDSLQSVLDEEGFAQTLEAYVVEQMANIINADDMFDIWKELNINVTRVNRGAPKEIQLFSRTLPEANGSMPHKEFERLRKVLKDMK
ncbi:MAG: hypothetical protein IJ099_01265 [Alphaproteobacteria bacterium]|nr:hypothetical protein [Alphaproteobacteria bacterium]